MKKLIALVIVIAVLTIMLFISCSPKQDPIDLIMVQMEEESRAGSDRESIEMALGLDKPAWEQEEEVIIWETEDVIEAPAPIVTERPEPPTIIVGPVVTSGSSSGEQVVGERMIIRNADMDLAVEDIPLSIEQIEQIISGYNGYTVSSRVWKQKERLYGSISVRVPVQNFENAIDSIRTIATSVLSESTSSKDVTEEYVDLSSKLSNLEATERQLLAIMEKAETVEDTLDVQSELSKVRGDIEQTKGRMQYLERTSATSLIEISLEQSELEVGFTAVSAKVGVTEKKRIRFYPEVIGGFPPYSYEWDFGDNEISSDESPTHTYKKSGTYTVILTVTDDRGNTDTKIRTDYITIAPGWSVGNIARDAWNGLVNFGHILMNILIWIGIFSPIWIVIGGLIILIRYRKKRKAESPDG